MSEKEKESITEKKISRRSMLKWTGALAAAVAVGVGAGYETNQLLRPITTFTQTTTQTILQEAEQLSYTIVGEISGGTAAAVYTKKGRLIRITPLVYTEDEAKPWSIKVGDKTFTPRKRSNLPPYDLAFRRYTYTPTRTMYPLKRVGFALGGQSDVSNRGKGEFVRITWDEALDTIASEMKRIKATYGNAAIWTIGQDTHGQYATVHMRQMARVVDFFGGRTDTVRNPDSWEGWYWGASHVWGFSWNAGQMDQRDCLEDMMQNAKLLIAWGFDTLTSQWISSNDHAQPIHWLGKELGMKNIYISPELNMGAGKYADKWIPIRPGTDAALAAAIANVWINEGTYDRDYVNTHGYGFDKWKDYVTGAEDGVLKTPQWAEQITGVKARVIRALAREWASKTTAILSRYGGGGCRGPYASEWPRMMVFLMAMQGLGKPGVNLSSPDRASPVIPNVLGLPRNLAGVAKTNPRNPVTQLIYQTIAPTAVLDPPVKWYGGSYAQPTSEQWTQKTYPLPGYPEVKMLWMDHVSRVTNWNCGNKWIEMYKSPKLQFILAQSPWLENDSLFADIVLPVTSTFEREDIGLVGAVPPGPGHGKAWANPVGVYMKKAIEPLGESKSDYEIYLAVAQRLGLEPQFSEGNIVEDWIKKLFAKSSLPKYITYESFKQKGYYVFKFPDDWPRNPGLRWFHDKTDITPTSGLITPSGKIEFYSQNLAKYFPDDKERPPVPHYIAEGPTHQESLTSARAKTYPLLIESPHPRYRFHSRNAGVTWLNELPVYKVLNNGVYYEAVLMNPIDAKARGIAQGDVVRIFNERGAVLAGAHVTERVMPGVVRIPNGSPYTPAPPGKPYQDAAGAINLITPYATTSANAFGMVCNAFLLQVEKWVG